MQRVGLDLRPACCWLSEDIRTTVFLNRLLLVGQLVVTLNVIAMVAADAAPAGLNFAGASFSPGSTVKANVPLSAQAKSYAVQGGNPVPPSAVAMMATTANSHSSERWPVRMGCP